MDIFIEKVGGEYCPSFRFKNQTFRLRGFDTKEEAEFIEQQLKACFSNYGLLITKNYEKKLLKDVLSKFRNLLKRK